MELLVKKEVKDSTIIFILKGILDITTTNVMDPYLEEIDNIETLVIDLSELEFLDSTGIGSIMNAIYMSQEKDFTLQLKGIDELTDQIFETVGLYQILKAMQGEVV
jgi:anti-anti-sigma factor